MTKILQSRAVRFSLFLLAVLLLIASVPPSLLEARANGPDTSTVSGNEIQLDFTATGAVPRDVETTTQAAIQREYASAWKNMDAALEQNRVDLLDQNFVGNARNQLGKQIQQQIKNGLSTKFIDHGHKVQVTFYSPEGTALQLHDDAQYEQQLLDGGKTVHTETIHQQYTVIFTLVGDRWKVRILQAVPAA